MWRIILKFDLPTSFLLMPLVQLFLFPLRIRLLARLRTMNFPWAQCLTDLENV